MAYACQIIADSIDDRHIARLTTFLLTFPRFILAEVNTHRMLSRNSASSRAIPVERRIAAILADPFIPESFGANQKGMQSEREVLDQGSARETWKLAMQSAVAHARSLAALEVHKQLANRILEPFAWHTAVITGTEWANFFAQRCHKDAQPEFRKLALMMREQYHDGATPRLLQPGQWHLPMIREDDREHVGTDDSFADRIKARDVLDGWGGGVEGFLAIVSAGRCARTSYETHDGRRDLDEDVGLFDRMIGSGHMSPLEHPARCMSDSWHGDPGNFRGPWKQLRKMVANEDVFHGE